MPRPRKCRRVCSLPTCCEFVTVGEEKNESVVLSVDEYESIRLIDMHGFSQTECAEFMRVSRATVQSIYNTARQKLASFLIDGRRLLIEGGDFKLCDDSESCHDHTECCKKTGIPHK